MDTPRNLLLQRLLTFAKNRQIAYGHQDDLVYGHTWTVADWENDSLERSDVKEVTGKYPMVVGFDLGKIQLGADTNLNHVPFGLMRKAALKHIERGGMVTFSWHPDNILTGGNAWDVSSDQVVKAILPGGAKHAEFLRWMQCAADFLESLGEVAVLFRPWHEHNGSWFWWGKELCTPDEYRALFRMTWRYFVQERGLVHLLWCYSPNGPVTTEGFWERYPGEEFVDLLGVDFYEKLLSPSAPEAHSPSPGGQETGNLVRESGKRFASDLKELLTTLTDLGEKLHKPTALCETGLEGLPDPLWWTQVLSPVIQDFPISYVLTWRNAYRHPHHFFAAWDGFESAADFKAFSLRKNMIFL